MSVNFMKCLQCVLFSSPERKKNLITKAELFWKAQSNKVFLLKIVIISEGVPNAGPLNHKSKCLTHFFYYLFIKSELGYRNQNQLKKIVKKSLNENKNTKQIKQ